MTGDFPITQGIFLLMRWLYENVPPYSLVLTILVSTFLIRAITVFGDIQSRKSSLKMQAIQPDLNRLKKKYANDPQKLQQAQSKFMREKGVSMWGGCLPMLITMPLFFCFIAAFRQWGYEQMVKVIVDLHDKGASATFNTFHFLWIHNIWQPDSGLAPVIMTGKEFLSIAGLDRLMYFSENPAAKALFQQLGFFVTDPKNIPQAALDTYSNLVQPLMTQYSGFNNGWFILPILAGGTTFLSSWIMQKGTPQSAANDQAASTNKTMMYVMPAMSVYFCIVSNAAFAMYWTFSNIVSVITTMFINRAFAKDMAALKPEEEQS